MRVGILADIHANEDALKAVLADGAKDVDCWYCIGDVVGRGPFPVETLQLLREHVASRHWLLGNHDAYVVGLLPYPAESIANLPIWGDHRRRVMAHAAGKGHWNLWRWCRQTWRPRRAEPQRIEMAGADCWAVHGVLGSWVLNVGDMAEYSYCLPWTALKNRIIMDQQFDQLRRLRRDGRAVALIHGHTHVPYVAFRSWDLENPVLLPIRYNHPLPLSQFDALLVCPGSVGQPHNGDPVVPVHAAYGILDTKASTFEFRRVPYDSERTWLEMGRRGYATELIEILKGNHVGAGQQTNNDQWLHWQQTYRAQPWGWEPILIGSSDTGASS